MQIVTHSKEETAALGEKLARRLGSGSVVAFTGGLGAGKTAFCEGIAKGLGCIDPVQSPTFSIVNLYRGPQPFAHFDLYRIHSYGDLLTSGFFDYIDEGVVVAAEWSENAASFLEEPLIRVDISVINETTRLITITGIEEPL